METSARTITLLHSASEYFCPSTKETVTTFLLGTHSITISDFCVFLLFRTFPNCKFGDKCLFVHPNCKYDARCSKPECPFTHVSRRSTVAPPPRPGTLSWTLCSASPWPLHALAKCISNLTLCVHSNAASAEHYCVSLLPRLQEDGVSVLSSEGKIMWHAGVGIWSWNSRIVVEQRI